MRGGEIIAVGAGSTAIEACQDFGVRNKIPLWNETP